MKVDLHPRNGLLVWPEDIGMHQTSTYTAAPDPLQLEHRRLWATMRSLVADLAALGPTEGLDTTARTEQRVLEEQLRRLRRQSARIAEVLRSEAWARGGAM